MIYSPELCEFYIYLTVVKSDQTWLEFVLCVVFSLIGFYKFS